MLTNEKEQGDYLFLRTSLGGDSFRSQWGRFQCRWSQWVESMGTVPIDLYNSKSRKVKKSTRTVPIDFSVLGVYLQTAQAEF